MLEKSPPEYDPKWTRLCDFRRPEGRGAVVSGKNVKAIEGYAVLNLEVASFNSFRDIQENHFAAEALTDNDDSIKRRSIRVSLKNASRFNLIRSTRTT